MDRGRAHELVNSIIDSQVEAVGAHDDPTRVRQALHNAKSDLHGLVDQIFQDLADTAIQFEEAVESALGIQIGDGNVQTNHFS